jgi:hypothetical protein
MADDNLRDVLNATHDAVSRQLERERHHPVGEPMSEAEARKLTDQIKHDAEVLWDNLVAAYLGRADIALGYESWDTYCTVEFGSLRLRLPREERAEMVCSLRQSGLSNRAIASAIGISEGTVRNDQKSAAQNYAPDEREPWFTPPYAPDEDEHLIEYAPDEAEPPTEYTPAIGLDRKTYQPIAITHREDKIYPPSRPIVITHREDPPTPPYVPTPRPSDAELFGNEMGELNRAIEVLSALVSRATDEERAELAVLWTEDLADCERRLGDVTAELFRSQQA